MSLIRITYVITGLAAAGAETMLVKLLAHAGRGRFEPDVVSLMPCRGLPLAETIQGMNIPLRSLRMAPGRPSPLAAFRLARHLRLRRPHLVSGWEVHGNLAAMFSSFLTPPIPTVWNVRGSLDDIRSEKLSTRLAIRALAAVSHRPSGIIYNSKNSRQQHEKYGYCQTGGVVIPNGFDTLRFAPDPHARLALRAELRLPPDAFLAGMIARYHPVKDHTTLLHALAQTTGIHLVLAGRGAEPGNHRLSWLIDNLGLTRRVSLLGERTDVPRIAAALDVACLSSVAEGFPNVVGEAMAAAVPCIGTDVGDVRDIIGAQGWTVPPRQPAAFARALMEAAAMHPSVRAALGLHARRRIQSEYSLDRIATLFDEAHFAAVERHRARPGVLIERRHPA